MNEFERILSDGLAVLSKPLRDMGLSPTQADGVIHDIRSLHLPGLLSLLATPDRFGEPFGETLLAEASEAVSRVPDIEKQGLSFGDVNAILTGIFRRRSVSDNVHLHEQLRTLVLETALKELGRRVGVMVTPEQADALMRLLATGDLYTDISASTAAFLQVVEVLPAQLIENTIRLPDVLTCLLRDLGNDLQDVPGFISSVLRDMTARSRPAMKKTLLCLYRFAPLESVLGLLGELIRPDNETVRILIVIYARSNGIPLNESDLDVLRTSVLRTEDPDLGPVLITALRRLEEQYGSDGFPKVLKTMA